METWSNRASYQIASRGSLVNLGDTAVVARKKQPGRERKLTFTYKQLCDLAGGEEYLKDLRHPITGNLYFSSGKNPFPNWKQTERKGFPQHFIIALLLDRIKRADIANRQISQLSPELHGEAIMATVAIAKTLENKGIDSEEWRALKSFFRVITE